MLALQNKRTCAHCGNIGRPELSGKASAIGFVFWGLLLTSFFVPVLFPLTFLLLFWMFFTKQVVCQFCSKELLTYNQVRASYTHGFEDSFKTNQDSKNINLSENIECQNKELNKYFDGISLKKNSTLDYYALNEIVEHTDRLSQILASTEKIIIYHGFKGGDLMPFEEAERQLEFVSGMGSEIQHELMHHQKKGSGVNLETLVDLCLMYVNRLLKNTKNLKDITENLKQSSGGGKRYGFFKFRKATKEWDRNTKKLINVRSNVELFLRNTIKNASIPAPESSHAPNSSISKEKVDDKETAEKHSSDAQCNSFYQSVCQEISYSQYEELFNTLKKKNVYFRDLQSETIRNSHQCGNSYVSASLLLIDAIKRIDINYDDGISYLKGINQTLIEKQRDGEYFENNQRIGLNDQNNKNKLTNNEYGIADYLTQENEDGEIDVFASSGKLFINLLRSSVLDSITSPLTPAIRKDRHRWSIIEGWLGCSGRELTAEDNEKISLAWKAYGAIGIAPSVKLQPSFNEYRDHYESIEFSIEDNEPPSEVIEGVFDKLLATDQERERKYKLDANIEHMMTLPSLEKEKNKKNILFK